MKYVFAFSLFALSYNAQAQTNVRLGKTIDSLYDVDQAVQIRLKELSQAGAPADSVKKQDSIKKQTYMRHTSMAKRIYSKYGYPTARLVGADPSHHFFVLIQHADAEQQFQVAMLPILEKLSRKGSISRKDYAYLYDRVQRNTGGKQLYGTQLTYGPKANLFDQNDKIMYPPDLADPKHVDQRRKAVGLGPIEEYYESVLQMLCRPRVKN